MCVGEREGVSELVGQRTSGREKTRGIAKVNEDRDNVDVCVYEGWGGVCHACLSVVRASGVRRLSRRREDETRRLPRALPCHLSRVVVVVRWIREPEPLARTQAGARAQSQVRRGSLVVVVVVVILVLLFFLFVVVRVSSRCRGSLSLPLGW